MVGAHRGVLGKRGVQRANFESACFFSSLFSVVPRAAFLQVAHGRLLSPCSLPVTAGHARGLDRECAGSSARNLCLITLTQPYLQIRPTASETRAIRRLWGTLQRTFFIMFFIDSQPHIVIILGRRVYKTLGLSSGMTRRLPTLRCRNLSNPIFCAECLGLNRAGLGGPKGFVIVAWRACVCGLGILTRPFVSLRTATGCQRQRALRWDVQLGDHMRGCCQVSNGCGEGSRTRQADLFCFATPATCKLHVVPPIKAWRPNSPAAPDVQVSLSRNDDQTTPV